MTEPLDSIARMFVYISVVLIMLSLWMLALTIYVLVR